MKTKLPTLEELDLSPRGATLVDLLNDESVIGFRPFGTTYSTRMKDWTPEKGKEASRDRDLAEAVLKRSKRSQMMAFLNAHGVNPWGKRTKASLATSCMLVIDEKWYPREFINALPNVYVCSCGHEGPATLNGKLVCGANCGRPSYALTIKGGRVWQAMQRRAPKSVSCCREPKVRGGRCDNCGKWIGDEPNHEGPGPSFL